MADEYVIDTRSATRKQGQRRVNAVKTVAAAPKNVATSVTQRSGYSGKGILTAELLIGFLIVAIRVVADYEVQEDGTVQGKVGHPSGQYGPLPILAGLIATFFVLSFVAVGGGVRAKVATLLGASIVLVLGMKSLTEIEKAGKTFGNIGLITVGTPSGSEGSGASATNAGATSGATSGSSSLGGSSFQAASNAFGAFQRLEQSNVTGVGSAIKHAVGGTVDLGNAAVDAALAEAQLAQQGITASAPAASTIGNIINGAKTLLHDLGF